MQTFGTVAARSHSCRAHFRLHPHLACRLPYRFPRGRFTRLLRVRVPAPWLPYRFPRGRLRTVILLDAALAVGKHVAWSAARLSKPCTQLAANFELATEAINGEFVKG